MYKKFICSADYYDKYRKSFPSYKKKHRFFFDAINKEIITSSKKGILNILDVGCGDGERGLLIAKETKAKNIEFLDNCKNIILENKKISKEKIYVMDISDPNLCLKTKYDIVLCLNNVLGHVIPEKSRVEALKNLRKLVNKNGKIYLDINNRYNIANYGIKRGLKNILNDFCNVYASKNGDFPLPISNSGVEYVTIVHLFTKLEILKLIKDSGLVLREIKYINYRTGKFSRSQYGGQIYLVLEK